MVSLDAKKDAAMGTLKDSISGLFDEYNPEKIIKDCQDQLKTPVVSKQVLSYEISYAAEPGK